MFLLKNIKFISLLLLGMNILPLWCAEDAAVGAESVDAVTSTLFRSTGKTIYVQSLHLHGTLTDFREVIGQHVSLIHEEEGKKKLSDVLEKVEDAIKKLHEIVDIFNSDTFYSQQNHNRNLEVQYKFVNACNLLKNIENVEPRHLRKLRSQFEAFDQFVKEYCLREKNSLTVTEIDVFNKITQFNQLLLVHLLKKEYLRIDFADKFVDTIFYRPLEVIGEYPLLTTALVAAMCLVSYLVWDQYLKLRNLNDDVEVKQFRVRNQYGLTCGLHSAYNLMCFMHGQNDDQISVLLADSNAFNTAYHTCRRVNNTDSGLHGGEVQHLLDAYNVPDNVRPNITIIEGQQMLDQLGINNDFIPGIEGARARFNAADSEPQYFLINLAAQSDPHATDAEIAEHSYGHWLPFKFIKDASARGGVRVLTAESSWNSNITALSVINRIAQFLTANRAAVPAQ